jgi:hypothetical protein
LDRPASNACSGRGIGCDHAAHQPKEKPMSKFPEPVSKITKIREMTVTITRGHNDEGPFVRIHATKGGKPFDDEDRTQLQILEHEFSNNRPSPVTIDRPLFPADSEPFR